MFEIAQMKIEGADRDLNFDERKDERQDHDNEAGGKDDFRRRDPIEKEKEHADGS